MADIVNAKMFESMGLKQEQMEAVAEVTNAAIKQASTVLYGLALDDGTATDFSTEQKPTDFHVCFAIGIKPMGTLPLIDKKVLTK